MNARSALFDVYGDHLRPRGGAAPVAALVRLLAPLGIAAPAVRTAISRMVRQGWLEPVRPPTARATASPPRAERRWTTRTPGSTAPQRCRLGRPLAPARRPPPRPSAPPATGSQRAWPSSATPSWTTRPGSAPRPPTRSTRCSAGGRPGGAVQRAPRRRHAALVRGLGPRGPREVLRALAARRARHRGGGRRATSDERRSPPAPAWSTSGASSCSSTRACRTPCCPRRWPGQRAAALFDAAAVGCCPRPAASSTSCLGPSVSHP